MRAAHLLRILLIAAAGLSWGTPAGAVPLTFDLTTFTNATYASPQSLTQGGQTLSITAQDASVAHNIVNITGQALGNGIGVAGNSNLADSGELLTFQFGPATEELVSVTVFESNTVGGGDTVPATVAFFVDGVLKDTRTFGGTLASQVFTLDFSAQHLSGTEFRLQSTAGSFRVRQIVVDPIVVSQVPVPATLSLLALGALGLGVWTRRR